MCRTGGPYREECVGARPRPSVPTNPAEILAVGCHAAHQVSFIAPHAHGVP